MKTAGAQPHRLNTPERCRRLRTRGRGSESRSELRAPELRCLVSSLPRSRRETALTEWLWADLSKKKGWWALSPNKKNGYGPGLQVVGLGLSLWPKIASRVRAESPNLRAGAEHRRSLRAPAAARPQHHRDVEAARRVVLRGILLPSHSRRRGFLCRSPQPPTVW